MELLQASYLIVLHEQAYSKSETQTAREKNALVIFLFNLTNPENRKMPKIKLTNHFIRLDIRGKSSHGFFIDGRVP